MLRLLLPNSISGVATYLIRNRLFSREQRRAVIHRNKVVAAFLSRRLDDETFVSHGPID